MPFFNYKLKFKNKVKVASHQKSWISLARFFYHLKQILVMEKSSTGRAQDRSKVAGGQKHEVNYESSKLKVSGEEVKKAVKEVGNSRKKVETKLKGK
ncbi:hypothetical protein BH11BAC6_BH11BAC6_12630 [soil metagenome]